MPSGASHIAVVVCQLVNSRNRYTEFASHSPAYSRTCKQSVQQVVLGGRADGQAAHGDGDRHRGSSRDPWSTA